MTSSCVRSGDRGRALDGVAARDLHLGAKRVLALDDVAGDVLEELLHGQHLTDHELVDGLLELGEPRHVHALSRGVEVDEAVDLGGDEPRRPRCCMQAVCTPVTLGAGRPSCTSGTEGCACHRLPVVAVSLRSIRRT